jgi:hypothetical protein
MIHLKASQYRRMPWKNGLGETTEIAVFPPDTGLESFDWRISMARVSASGPFSVFPGIDRNLVVLSGGTLCLAIDGQASTPLDPLSPPYAFAGDAHTEATLIGADLVDFNVMTRRGRMTQQVTRLTLQDHLTQHIDGDTTLLFCIGPEATIDTGRTRLILGPHDAILCDRTDAALAMSAPVTTALIRVDLTRLA